MNLRQARQLAGLGLRECARAAKMDATDLSRLERGMARLHPGWVKRLGDVLLPRLQ